MYGDGYYSQSEEDKVLEKYFEGHVGRLLDIGAYHPTVFSNSRKLIEAGWEAVLVEASPMCIKTLREEYDGSDKVKVSNVAIAAEDGMIVFYDSMGALGTGDVTHYMKWRNLQLDYKKTMVPGISWKTFYKGYPGVFDFINIDVEGMDWEVLSQIDLNETQTKVVCIEASSTNLLVLDYLQKYNFTKVLLRNLENLIIARG